MDPNIAEGLGGLGGSALANAAGGLSMTGIVGGLIFSGIGLVALMQGKKAGDFRLMAVAGLLLLYPYFITSAVWVYLIGAGLTAAAYLVRE